MSEIFDYLRDGLLEQGAMRTDLQQDIANVAGVWLAAGIEPVGLEAFSELLARTARSLGDDQVGSGDLIDLARANRLPDTVSDWLKSACSRPLGETALAALAVHLIDIVEACALRIYIPELAALSAKSDRSGDAARRTGAARHLRG